MRLAALLLFLSAGVAQAVPERVRIVLSDSDHVYVAWSAAEGSAGMSGGASP